MRLLGIDYGEKRIGLAIGDSETALAFPFDVILREGAGAKIRAILEKEGLEGIVIGMPYTPDGEKRKSAERVEAFIEELRVFKIGVPIETVDERDTTIASHALRDETGTREDKDALAAMFILNEYFSKE